MKRIFIVLMAILFLGIFALGIPQVSLACMKSLCIQAASASVVLTDFKSVSLLQTVTIFESEYESHYLLTKGNTMQPQPAVAGTAYDNAFWPRE